MSPRERLSVMFTMFNGSMTIDVRERDLMSAETLGRDASHPLAAHAIVRGDRTPRPALLWQIYSSCVFVHIHFRQCGHGLGGGRAMSAMME